MILYNWRYSRRPLVLLHNQSLHSPWNSCKPVLFFHEVALIIFTIICPLLRIWIQFWQTKPTLSHLLSLRNKTRPLLKRGIKVTKNHNDLYNFVIFVTLKANWMHTSSISLGFLSPTSLLRQAIRHSFCSHQVSNPLSIISLSILSVFLLHTKAVKYCLS